MGLWLAIPQVTEYLQVTKSCRDAVSFRPDNWPDVGVCTSFGCAPYSEIQRDFMTVFAIDATIFAIAAALLLVVWRKRAKARNVV